MYDDYLYQFCLLKLPNGNSGYTMSFHHICSDVTSIISIAHRIDSVYKSFLNDLPETPRLETSYKEFISREQEYLTSNRFLRGQEFWLSENLQDLPEYKLFEGSRHKEAKHDNIIVHEIPPGLIDEMTRFKAETGISSFKLFLSALALFIHRITSLESFGISFFGKNRPYEKLRTTAGMFVGTYPLRVDVDTNITFLEFINNLAVKINAIVNVHGSHPFDELAKLIREKHKADISHLINISIIAMYFPKNRSYSLHQLNINDIQNQLTMYIRKYENPAQKPTITFQYDNTIYQKNDIEALYDGVISILDNFFRSPNATIRNLSLLSKKQYQRVIFDLNNTAKPFPKDKCTHHIFEQATLKFPTHTAVEFNERAISYYDLNRQADDLAEILKNYGIGAEQLVGVYLNRSIGVVISLLAILKAGGAYVPIDPYLPAERVRFILQDSKVSCLVIDEELVDNTKEVYKGRLIVHTIKNGRSGFNSLETSSRSYSRGESRPENLMYVIYTSGSTGEPKGVMIEHHSFVNIITDQVNRYKLTENDRVLNYLSLGFDAANEHLFKALCSGARVCLADIQKDNYKNDIREILKSLRITCCAFPAPLLGVLDEKEYPLLRVVNSGADKCTLDILKRWSSGRHFFNSYGPTETTVISTIAKLDKENTEPHIGKPVANTQVYVLDNYGMPLPIGCEGELYIGGEGVARGYLNHPELSKEKFVRNPFDKSGKSRLYKTGDIVLFGEDGNIFFKGRRDTQVKIRGYRIESEEIEGVLKQSPMIAEATVLVKTSGNSKKLIAFIIGINKNEIDLVLLKNFLAKQLPNYMIPEQLIEIDKIPLTINGKTDRKALLNRVDLSPVDKNKIPPQTNTEYLLHKIWSKALKIENISISDNFYYLGGDSLLTIAVCAEIETELEHAFSVQQFMDYPTIELAGKMIDQGKAETELISTIKKHPSSNGSIIVTHNYGGDPNLANMLGREMNNYFDIYATSMSEQVFDKLNPESLEEIALFLVGKFKKMGLTTPYLVCGFSWGGILAFETVRQFEKQGIPVELLLLDSPIPGYQRSPKEKFYQKLNIAYKVFYPLVMPIVLIFGLTLKSGRENFMSDWLEIWLKYKRVFIKILRGIPEDPESSLFQKNLVLGKKYTLKQSSFKIHYINFQHTSFPLRLLNLSKEIWGNYSTKPLNLMHLKGDHVSLIGENLKKVVKIIQEIGK